MDKKRKGDLKRMADAAGQPLISYIRAAVEAHGTVSGAAKALGVSATAMHYHLNRAGLKAIKVSKIEAQS